MRLYVCQVKYFDLSFIQIYTFGRGVTRKLKTTQLMLICSYLQIKQTIRNLCYLALTELYYCKVEK